MLRLCRALAAVPQQRALSTTLAAAGAVTTPKNYRADANGKPLDTEATRRQLLYHASKRGMLENELILSGYARQHLPKMDDADLREFKVILDQVERPPSERERARGRRPMR